MRGGGVEVTTNRQTRDEGSDKEGKDGKGDGNAMSMTGAAAEKEEEEAAARRTAADKR